MGSHLLHLVQQVNNLHLESLDDEDEDCDDFDDCCFKEDVIDDGFTYCGHGDLEEGESDDDNDIGAVVTRLNAASLLRASNVCKRLDFSGEIVDDHQKHRPCSIDMVDVNAPPNSLTFDTGTAVVCECKKSYNKYHPDANIKPELTAQSSISNSYTRSSRKHISIHKRKPRPAKGFSSNPVVRKDKEPISFWGEAVAEKSCERTYEHLVKPTPVYESKRTSGYNYGLPLSSPATPNKKQAVEQRISVCVRKRPLTLAERRRGNEDVVTTQGDCVIVHKSKEAVDLTQYILQHRFYFDQVFGDETSNEDVYRRTAYPLVQHMLNGGKATCFAYGQTGAGKTHTMLGSCPRTPGLYVLAAQDIFAHLSATYTSSSHLVYVSFFEIYCGQLYDLLDHRKRLFAREDGDKVVHIAGLSYIRVDSVNSLLKVISHGTEVRSQGVSGVNPVSSRSHALLQIQLRGPNQQKAGRMWFVDLAGSERASDTKQPGKQTRMEGAEINQSLLALKECIRSLDQEQAHTPFRQSKLTQVLKDSFVGDSKTCMIANISPGHFAAEHTLNTLRYADRVKELRGQAGERGGRRAKGTCSKRNQMTRSSQSDTINMRGKSPPKKLKLKSHRKAFTYMTSATSAPMVSRNLCSTPRNSRWEGDINAEERVVAGLKHITPVRGLLGTYDNGQQKAGAGELEGWNTEVEQRAYGGTEAAGHLNKQDQHVRAKLIVAQALQESHESPCFAQRETVFIHREKEKEQNMLKWKRKERTRRRQEETTGEALVGDMDLEDIEERYKERKRHLTWYHQQLQQCVSSSASSSAHFSSSSITPALSSSPRSSNARSSLQHSSHLSKRSVSPVISQGLKEVLDGYRATVDVRSDGNSGKLSLWSEENPLQTKDSNKGDEGCVDEAAMAHLEGAGPTVKDGGEREIAGGRKSKGKGEEQNPSGMGRGQRRPAWATRPETKEADRMLSLLACHTDILESSNHDSDVRRRRPVEQGRVGGDTSDVPGEGHWRIEEERAYSCSIESTSSNINSNSLFGHEHVEYPCADKPNEQAPAEQPLSPAFERTNNLLAPNKLCEWRDTRLTSHILPLMLQDVIPFNSPREVPSCSTQPASKASIRGFPRLPSHPLTASLIQNDGEIPAESRNKISENPASVSTGLTTTLPHAQTHKQPEVKAIMPVFSLEETSGESLNYTMDPLSISLLQVDQQPATASFLLCPPESEWREDDGNGGSAETAEQGAEDEEGEFRMSLLDLEHAIQTQSMTVYKRSEQRDMCHVTHHVNTTGPLKPPVPVVISLKRKISPLKPQAQPDIVIPDGNAPASPWKPVPQTSLNLPVSSLIQQFEDSRQLGSCDLLPPPMQMQPAEYLPDMQTAAAAFTTTLQSESDTGRPHSAEPNNLNGSLQLNCTPEINSEEKILNEQKRPTTHLSAPEDLDHDQLIDHFEPFLSLGGVLSRLIGSSESRCRLYVVKRRRYCASSLN
ncbi:uncharacterized protein LOC143012056 isoform X2 [Genypterus blacodes]|uniref:uncharacterized protein LOC143012056 isoform X2 n=1 Tax=Genypterus blacodes TaxID=154954 RepID=UPI003F7653AA